MRTLFGGGLRSIGVAALMTVFSIFATDQQVAPIVPGTARLDASANWREEQRGQILRWLDDRIARTQVQRDAGWNGMLASPAAFIQHADLERKHLAALTGRSPHGKPRVKVEVAAETAVSRTEEVEIDFEDGFTAQALVIWPKDGNPPSANVICLRDGESAHEAAASVSPGPGVIAILETVSRGTDHPLCRKLGGFDRRRILYRLAGSVGKTLPGLESEQASAIRQYLVERVGDSAFPVSIQGRSQGGMTALLTAALDPAFSKAEIADYFGPREGVPEEPVDRSIYGQLLHFGDAEIAALIAPRSLRIDGRSGPDAEFRRAQRYYRAAGSASAITYAAATGFDQYSPQNSRWTDRNFEHLHDYLVRATAQTQTNRYEHWGLLKPAPSPEQKSARMRKELAEFMGVPSDAPAPLNPRTRLLLITDKYVAYEVKLGVIGGIEAYGHLLIPRNTGTRSPAVICQHGLDGEPKDITGVGPKPAPAYHEFGRKLAERGYVVFAPYLTVPSPQAELINPIVRKAAAIGMMRTAIETRKLSRIVDFLQTLPFVDGDRIGYYGLSYGGYSTIWMGPLEPRLKTVVISGHFNDWTSKITNEELRTSYLMHPDEDFFNFNVLNRFTHPELIAAMLPRPVMVEFAERDATTTPEWHLHAWKQAAEIARALKASSKLARDHFDGTHEIGGTRTFEWLDRWLRPERNSAREYTYLLWPSGRELPGLADNAADTYPYDEMELGGPGQHLLRDSFHAGTSNTVFRGMAFALSRAEDAPPLIVKYGSARGLADIGTSRIDPATVHPLFDLWYDAPIRSVLLKPGRQYYVEIATNARPGSKYTGNYVVYGPKPLGGHALPNNFFFAYRPLPVTPVRNAHEATFEFVRQYLNPPQAPVFNRHTPKAADEIELDSTWAMQAPAGDPVVATAVSGLSRYLNTCCAIRAASTGSKRVVFRVKATVPQVHDGEGFRVDARDGEVEVSATTGRGIMRGIYWLEDMFGRHQAAIVPGGETVRNSHFARRMTTSILPGGERYTETSRPLLYTDGLLERMSRDGFNAVWIWLNTEEAATGSKLFPELDDPHALERLGRIQKLTQRAQRYGIDVYVYLATGYNHWIPASFYEKHPELKGFGFGSPMCTSDRRTLQYHAEIVHNIMRYSPGVKGLVVIYDHEGFYYCGNTEAHRQLCPRCRNSTCERLASQVIENLDRAIHEAGGPQKEFIAYSYGTESWVDNVIPAFPRDVKVQVDFSKGGEVVRDGIRHRTGDYNLTLVGPPDFFERRNAMAAKLGLDFITKTEHAVSQEFIFVPYIPAMEQWYRRISKIREYPAAGWFGNWTHYGYLASLPAQLINRMSFDPQPARGQILTELAETNYGEAAAPLVLKAWNDFSEGIRQFPYSDAVSRLPGPLQKGPSQPLFLDPAVKGLGSWRSWQNDLDWTKPWGPEVAFRYLAIVRDAFARGADALALAQRTAITPAQRSAIAGEWRISRVITCSLDSTLNQIDWIRARDRFYAAQNAGERLSTGEALRGIAMRERSNASDILPVLDSDSRLGYASEGGGVLRGGLFSPDLVRWKIGELDDVLDRQLPEALSHN